MVHTVISEEKNIILININNWMEYSKKSVNNILKYKMSIFFCQDIHT